MTSWEFPGSDPIEIMIDIAAGSVTVSAEPVEVTTVILEASGRDGTQLLEHVKVAFSEGRLEIIEPRNRSQSGLEVTVTAPAGSSCAAHAASADVSCLGTLAELEVRTASGEVTAESVTGPVEVKTASGDVWLERAGATAQVNTASGDIQLREAAGDVSAHTASGDVAIGQAAASVRAETASGDVQVGRATAGEVSVKTASGDVRVGVAAGVGVYLDLSSLTGNISNQLDETGASDDVRLQVSCRTVTGGIRITRAAPVPAG